MGEHVWRHGVIHELYGNQAFVVCVDEPLVKAVMVSVKQLCSALVPLHVLNREVLLTREDKYTPLEDNKKGEFAKENLNLLEEVEVEEAVKSLLLPGALLCSSATPLISILSPALSSQQKADLVKAACQDLSDLILHQPSTLEVLFPLMKQELARMVSSSQLVNLSQTEAGQSVLASLLPLLPPQKLALLASHILDNFPPASVNLTRMLLPLVDSKSVTFGLLSEAILGNHALHTSDHQAALLNQLLEFEDKDVAARVEALQI